MDETAVSRADARSPEMGTRTGHSHERTVAAIDRGTAAAGPGRRPAEQIRRCEGVLQLVGAQEVQTPCPRISQPVPGLCHLPGMWWDAPAGRSARGKDHWPVHYGFVQAHRERGAEVFCGIEADG